MKNRNKRLRVRHILLNAVLLLFLAAYIFPVLWMISSSVKSTGELFSSRIYLIPEALTLDHYREVFASYSIGDWFKNSLATTVGIAILQILVSFLAAFALGYYRTRLNGAVNYFLLITMVIPFQVLMYPLVRWMRVIGEFMHFRLLGTVGGIVFAYLGFGSPLSIFIFHGFIKNIPLEIEESATIDGCPKSTVFFRIVFPLLQPIIITVLILNGIWIWNDYLLPLLVLGSNGRVQTIPIAVTAFAGAYLKQWDLILTSTLIAMLPIIVLYIFAQRYIIKGMVEGSIK